MSSLVKSIEPNFLLRSVDPAVLLQYYFTEDLSDIELKRVSEATATVAIDSFKKEADVDQRYENSSSEELYRFKDRSGVYRFVGTVNHKLFNIVNIGDYRVNLEKLKCLWCRQRIRLKAVVGSADSSDRGERGPDVRKPEGRPEPGRTNKNRSGSDVKRPEARPAEGKTEGKREDKTEGKTETPGRVASEEEATEWSKQNMFAPIGIPHKIEFLDDRTVVHTTDFFCSFECCYAELKKEKNVPQCNQNPIYCDSISLLLYVFKAFYPNEELKPAYPWRLHEKNGGFLSDKDFRKNTHVYKQLPNLRFCPAKIEYLVS